MATRKTDRLRTMNAPMAKIMVNKPMGRINNTAGSVRASIDNLKRR